MRRFFQSAPPRLPSFPFLSLIPIPLHHASLLHHPYPLPSLFPPSCNPNLPLFDPPLHHLCFTVFVHRSQVSILRGWSPLARGFFAEIFVGASADLACGFLRWCVGRFGWQRWPSRTQLSFRTCLLDPLVRSPRGGLRIPWGDAPRGFPQIIPTQESREGVGFGLDLT